jgi:hypothetical protein
MVVPAWTTGRPHTGHVPFTEAARLVGRHNHDHAFRMRLNATCQVIPDELPGIKLNGRLAKGRVSSWAYLSLGVTFLNGTPGPQPSRAPYRRSVRGFGYPPPATRIVQMRRSGV